MLLLDVRQERPLVVDTEREDPVLVWHCEAGAVDCAICGSRGGLQVEPVEGGEHGEFDLEDVILGDVKGDVMVVVVFG